MKPVELSDYPFSRNFALILATFVALFVASWPIVLSLDLWAFKDRGNLLNLDYLLDKNLRLGVDTYYHYGLLPVFIQHVLFAIFGRGHWPMIGGTVVYMVLIAAFWAAMLRHLPSQRIWLIGVIATSPILFWVNPNFPYCLVLVSMFFSLLFLLERRPDIAFAVSTVGCVSVPSMPLVLAALLVGLIVVDWWTGTNRNVAHLIRQLAPGVIAYIALVLVLSFFFGWRSVAVTALPIQGAQFYKEAFHDGSVFSWFLFPGGVSALYYIGNRAGWWIVSTLALFAFGFFALKTMFRRRTPDPANSFLVICAVVHAVFAFFAYGAPNQHVIYDPLLIAGTLVGISRFTSGNAQRVLLIGYLGISFAAQASQVRGTLLAWKNTRASAEMANFYTAADWAAEWSNILKISRSKKFLLLSYGTGVHHYFPSVQTADVWMLNSAMLLPEDKKRLMAKIRVADVIAEDLNGPNRIIEVDDDIQGELRALCLKTVTKNFQIWWRRSPGEAMPDCKINLRDRSSKRLG